LFLLVQVEGEREGERERERDRKTERQKKKRIVKLYLHKKNKKDFQLSYT
jgi:hypothetical protein